MLEYKNQPTSGILPYPRVATVGLPDKAGYHYGITKFIGFGY